MKSLQTLMKRKKGVLGLNVVSAFIITLLVVAIVSFLAIIVMGAMNTSNVTTAGSLERNQTTAIFVNASQGVSSFWSNSITWFALLGIAVLVLIIVFIIGVVVRIRAGGGEGL